MDYPELCVARGIVRLSRILLFPWGMEESYHPRIKHKRRRRQVYRGRSIVGCGWSRCNREIGPMVG